MGELSCEAEQTVFIRLLVSRSLRLLQYLLKTGLVKRTQRVRWNSATAEMVFWLAGWLAGDCPYVCLSALSADL